MGIFAGIELGGTNCNIAIGDENGQLFVRDRIDTLDDPSETVATAVGRLAAHQARWSLDAIGVASFGPLDLAAGTITNTPKHGWQQTPLRRMVSEGLATLGADLPIGFDTDVNAAALAEWEMEPGAAFGRDVAVYVTVGTGIGGGGVIHGRVMHGLLHPEMGHMRLPRLPDDTEESGCDLHDDCLEGLAKGPVIARRGGKDRAEDVPLDHPAWDVAAHYVALGLANIICTLSPEVIVLGGGVMQAKTTPTMISRIRDNVRTSLSGYVDRPALTAEGISKYIVAPGHVGDASSGEGFQSSGVLGAILLARDALRRSGT